MQICHNKNCNAGEIITSYVLRIKRFPKKKEKNNYLCFFVYVDKTACILHFLLIHDIMNFSDINL